MMTAVRKALALQQPSENSCAPQQGVKSVTYFTVKSPRACQVVVVCSCTAVKPVLDRHQAAAIIVVEIMNDPSRPTMSNTKSSYDSSTLAILRQALSDVLTDERFLTSSTSAIEMAEHILALAATGERDIERLKSSAIQRLESIGTA